MVFYRLRNEITTNCNSAGLRGGPLCPLGRKYRPSLPETARLCAVDLYSRPSLALSRFLLRDAIKKKKENVCF